MAKLTWGLIGGGEGSQIGPAHRLGARLDGAYDFVAGALGETDSETEDFHAFIDFGGLFAADGNFNNCLHVGDIDSVAGDFRAINLDAQVGEAADLFDGHISSAAHFAEHSGNRFAFGGQHVEVVPENLDADL